MEAYSEGREYFACLKGILGVTLALQYKQGYGSENQNSEYTYTYISFLNVYLNSSKVQI